MKSVEISVANTVGGGVCLSTLDGQNLYAKISQEIQKGNKVILSFSGVTRMTTAFLNAAIGQLYGEFTHAQIKAHLGAPTDADQWHLDRIKTTTDRAKVFFSEMGEKNLSDTYMKYIEGDRKDG